VQGDIATEGAAFITVVGDLEKLRQQPDGPLMRWHSACAYSEMGRFAAHKLYDDPAWLYDNAEELLPSFVAYGEGIVAGYPFADDIAADRSLDCDCRAQRRMAQFIGAARGMIYVSLAGKPQEARGHGLEVKQEIYRLQEEEGLNTVQACDRLEIPYDIRKYGHVARFIKDVLKLERVSLMSNNWRKAIALTEEGLEVARVALMPAHLTNEARDYVNTKGAWLDHDIWRKSVFVFAEDGSLKIHNTMTSATEHDVRLWVSESWERAKASRLVDHELFI